jgi:hypothetical protein
VTVAVSVDVGSGGVSVAGVVASGWRFVEVGVENSVGVSLEMGEGVRSGAFVPHRLGPQEVNNNPAIKRRMMLFCSKETIGQIIPPLNPGLIFSAGSY